MNKELLIIFVRKPELGKVKTRLAATVGAEKALAVYQRLLQHTHDITLPLACHKMICYATDIPPADLWEPHHYQKTAQAAGDLGNRMQEAFRAGFVAGYERICIIGSDCYQLTSPILQQAFLELLQQEVVIGPSQDGGYYLLGMKQLHTSFFQHKPWSTAAVCELTLADARHAELSCALLPELIDIDEESDLVSMPSA